MTTDPNSTNDSPNNESAYNEEGPVEAALEDEQAEAYIRKPTACPFCGSDYLDGGSIQIEEGMAYQGVTCGNCGAEWEDIYQLRDIRVMRRPTKDNSNVE